MLTTMRATVREATVEDVLVLVEMGQRFLAGSPYRGRLAENPEQMATCVRNLIGSPMGHVLVLERGSVVVGVLGLVLFDHPLSGERIVSELFWWVDPEARGTGLRLLRQAEQWAKAQGAVKCFLIAPDARVGTLYERLGYQWLEAAYERTL